MNASEWLRGRAKAFRLDDKHIAKQLDSWTGDADLQQRALIDRQRGYRIAADELCILADELDREGQ